MSDNEELIRGDFGVNLVAQHNDLITASYSLSVLEKKLLLGCICKINSFEGITSDTPFSFSMEEAKSVLGIDTDNTGMVDKFRRSARNLMTKIVEHDSVKGWQDFTFAHTSEYDHSTKTMTIYFSKGIIPYLSELHNQFTTYRIMHVGSLKSKYAIRLYELLVMWNGQKYGKGCGGENIKKFTTDEFVGLVANGSKSYKKSVNMLKKRVIEPALEQINNETDVALEVKYIKSGRNITHIQLFFTVKPDWIEKEKKFKQRLDEAQIDKIANDPEFFKAYYDHEVYKDAGGIGAFLEKSKKLLKEDPKKHYPDYADYLK